MVILQLTRTKLQLLSGMKAWYSRHWLDQDLVPVVSILVLDYLLYWRLRFEGVVFIAQMCQFSIDSTKTIIIPMHGGRDSLVLNLTFFLFGKSV